MELLRFQPGSGLRSLVAAIGLALAFAALSSAATETYYFFVFNNPVTGHEDEYNAWYNNQHALDVVALPGFVTAQRFVMSDLLLFRPVDLVPEEGVEPSLC